jgi:hypothetical protein
MQMRVCKSSFSTNDEQEHLKDSFSVLTMQQETLEVQTVKDEEEEWEEEDWEEEDWEDEE